MEVEGAAVEGEVVTAAVVALGMEAVEAMVMAVEVEVATVASMATEHHL